MRKSFSGRNMQREKGVLSGVVKLGGGGGG